MPVPPPTLASSSTYTSSSSSSRTRAIADRVQLSRDYILCQFARNRVQFRDELLTVLQIELEPLDEILTELAVCTPLTQQQQEQQGVARKAQWEWKMQTDKQMAK